MKMECRTVIALALMVGLSGCANPSGNQVRVAAQSTELAEGNVLTAEQQKIFNSLLEAANQGNLDAQFILAQAYEKGDGIPQNLDQAFFWYGKAANAGHVPAQFFWGAMYASSRGTPLDVTKAIYWYKQAADKGYPDALYPVAYAYEFGLGGLKQDNEQALLWYHKAIDAGNRFALSRLAKAYKLGELDLSVDDEKAKLYDEKLKAIAGAKMIAIPVNKK